MPNKPNGKKLDKNDHAGMKNAAKIVKGAVVVAGLIFFIDSRPKGSGKSHEEVVTNGTDKACRSYGVPQCELIVCAVVPKPLRTHEWVIHLRI